MAMATTTSTLAECVSHRMYRAWYWVSGSGSAPGLSM